jgi:nicotinate-nucleotide adenylyltransferase
LRLGLLGGTFNPPHIGHLICAQEARAQLGLDRVELVPVHSPPHKEVIDDPGPEVRLELCRAAVAGDEGLGVCDVEVRRPGPSFTVDTLRELDPENQELTFIVGGDMAFSLPAWREPEAVLRLARLAVAEREEVRRDDVTRRLAPLHGGDRVVFFDMPRIDVSSSAIRERVAAGRPVRYLVPDAVAEAIAGDGLYRHPAAGRPAA